jgi:hypothetical protein
MAEASREHIPRAANLYDYLQVSPRADAGVIHAAYRALARQYHPDVNNSSHASRLMREINAAYHVLGDPDRRARYDAHRARQIGHRSQRTTVRSAPANGRVSPVPPTRVGAQRQPPLRHTPGSSGRPIVVVMVLGLTLIGVLVIALWLAIASLDDRPPNLAGAQPVLNRPSTVILAAETRI